MNTKLETYYIDLGSSTVKFYIYDGELRLERERSIYFKDGFTTENGISEQKRRELVEYLGDLKREYGLSYDNTHIYATGIFRKLDEPQRRQMARLINDGLDLDFDIISHGIENYYLQKAMTNDYGGKKVLIINMGGKTTELVTYQGKEMIGATNLEVGVAELMNQFPEVNNKYSDTRIDDMERFVAEQMKGLKLDSDYDAAIFTGGEERLELLAGFNLIKNTLFDDGIHKYMVSLNDYIKGTEKLFYGFTIDELYELMPDNPKWMDGARPGAVLPLPLFRACGAKWIVPSDLNLINGVVNDN